MATQGQAFTLLLEKGLASRIILSEWCCTMDIVALVTEDGQLQLFRLNWQRLWSKTPDSGIKSICWRSDGKELAYGDDSGCVHILSPEDGSVIESRRIFEDGAVCALTWNLFAKAGYNPHLGSPVGYRGPRLLFSETISREYMSTSEDGSRHENRALSDDLKSLRFPGTLGLMSAVNDLGEAVICGEGLHAIASFRISKAKTGCINKLRIVVSQDIDEICAIWCDEHGWLKVSTVDTSVVARNAQVLNTIGSLIADIHRDLYMSYEVLLGIRKMMDQVNEKRESFFSGLKSMLNGERDPERDIYDFISRGAYSMELRSFVSDEQKTKDAARTIDKLMSDTHIEMVKYLQPALERISFRLGELRGHAASPNGKMNFGFQSSDFGSSERRMLNLIGLAEQLRSLFLQASSSYRVLFSFLTILSRRDAGEMVKGLNKKMLKVVMDFLMDNYLSEEIQKFLDAILEQERKEDKELVECILNREEEMSECKVGTICSYDVQDRKEEEDALKQVFGKMSSWLVQETETDVAKDLLQDLEIDSLSYNLKGLDCAKAWFVRGILRQREKFSAELRVVQEWSLATDLQQASLDACDVSYTSQGKLNIVHALQSESGESIVFFYDLDAHEGGSRRVAMGSLANHSVSSVGFYKDHSVFFTSLVGQDSLMSIIPLDVLSFEDYNGALEPAEVSLSRPGVIPVISLESCRTRVLEASKVSFPLAVSPSRGVALVCSDGYTVMLLDLEEDEDEEYDDEDS
eukprot:jgi/Picsp_1/3949/NSC_01461-R1_anaphase-promoting complex